jgi:nucleoside-diphosphate-sugar epimerase
MKVLVIGGTGFLSSAIVSELQAAGHDLTLFTRGERPLPEGLRVIRGDRDDREAFPRHFEGRPFDAVIDCICYTPEDAASDIRAFGGRVGQLVLISTDFVYGPIVRLPIDEDNPTRALNQYGRDKAACEALFLAAHREEGFPVTILRPPHVMGAGGHLGTGSLHGRDPMLLDRLQRGAPVFLLDGGALLIQPVLHRDVGRACRAVLRRENTLGQAYNTAGPDCVTTREYYELVAATLGIEEPELLSLPSADFVRAFPDRAPFAQHRMYSLDKLERDTGYRPQTGIRHAVFEMVDWLQASGAARPYRPTEQDDLIAALCRAFSGEAAKILPGNKRQN